MEEADMRQRRWLIGIVVLLLATGVPVSGLWAQAKPVKVTIGYQVIPNNEIIAKANGWHEKEMGVKIDWKQCDWGRAGNPAMAAGSIDIGLGGSSPAAAGISAGVPYEVIWLYDVIADNERSEERRVGKEGRSRWSPYH